MATLVEGKNLFVDLQMVGYPKQAPKAISEGISTQKRYYDISGHKIKLENIKTGEYVLVRMDVTASQRMPDALLVDLLPAGFEIENPGLEYSFDYSDLMVESYSVARWQQSADIKHLEYRDDRFVAALSLEDKQWATIFYLMRAVTAGSYQVPPTQVEDMYRPHLRALSETIKPVKVLAR